MPTDVVCISKMTYNSSFLCKSSLALTVKDFKCPVHGKVKPGELIVMDHAHEVLALALNHKSVEQIVIILARPNPAGSHITMDISCEA